MGIDKMIRSNKARWYVVFFAIANCNTIFKLNNQLITICDKLVKSLIPFEVPIWNLKNVNIKS